MNKITTESLARMTDYQDQIFYKKQGDKWDLRKWHTLCYTTVGHWDSHQLSWVSHGFIMG